MNTRFLMNCCRILSALFILFTISSGPERSWAQGGSRSGYVGCFKDKQKRDLDGFVKVLPNLTIERCIRLCSDKGFDYAGMQIGSRCFCGNSYGRYGLAGNCDRKCFWDHSQICGGA